MSGENWPFGELGIQPTVDRKSVRRAYARKLKSIDQATQAEEFQNLRKAYEIALDYTNNPEWTCRAFVPPQVLV